jgi:hypothetical protein
MFCCVGLVGGFAVGQYLGGPWTVVAPAAGFGVGLLADMKLMKGMHKSAEHGEEAKPGAHGPAAASREDKREMTLAEIRRTYQTDRDEAPVPPNASAGSRAAPDA